jgi:excisionase family DNA binding protein
MQQLLSLEEAAEILGVDYKTVYRLVRRGDLAAGRIGRVYRLSREDLEQYFDSTKQAVATEAGRSVIALQDLRCCVTGDRIISFLDIGGYAADTGSPIKKSAWDDGHRHAVDAAAHEGVTS